MVLNRMTDFQRARTEEQVADRRREILEAAADLYVSQGYDAVTFKAIGARTSITRPSLYNYYRSREEVLLDLLRQDYADWYADLQQAFAGAPAGGRPEFCRRLTDTLVRHQLMLQLLSINLRAIESESRPEMLVGFKRICLEAMGYLGGILAQWFPAAGAAAREGFFDSFSVLLLGIYPHTHHTERQLSAMREVGFTVSQDFAGVCYRTLLLIAPAA